MKLSRLNCKVMRPSYVMCKFNTTEPIRDMDSDSVIASVIIYQAKLATLVSE